MNDDFVPNSGIARAPATSAKTKHDHLPLPDGRKIGEVKSAELFRLFAALGVPGVAAENGREANVNCFAAHLERIRFEAATAAMNAFLTAGRAS